MMAMWRFFRQGWVLMVLFMIALLAPAISSEKPLVMRVDGVTYWPMFESVSERTLGGSLQSAPRYRDAWVQEVLSRPGNWAWFPLNPYSADTIDLESATPFPSPPDARHWFGTDAQGRDLFARVVEGFQFSVLFGLSLAAGSLVVGAGLGALQGYVGGWVDLILQRLTEAWSLLPELLVLLLVASLFTPHLGLLWLILLAFGWMGVAEQVRAEVLKNRHLGYVTAARAMGLSGFQLVTRHLLPNSLAPALSVLPLRVLAAVLSLVSLDFLGVSWGVEAPTLGGLLAEAATTQSAWWQTSFVVGVLFILLLALSLAAGLFGSSSAQKHPRC
ncbi:MAG: hypothetical protein RLZZ290_853 [Pseudomonadota bacterium]|jgi:microcin C transport system permease protein